MTGARGHQPGLLLVVSGPSGVGKTTIVREIEQRLGAQFSISATTRPKAASEVHGRDYYFLTKDEFQERIDADDFLEYACVFGKHWYGTPRGPVETALREGKLVILEIDVQGGVQVRKAMSDAMLVFIQPPNRQALVDRLRARGREDEETIQERFAQAEREIQLAHASGAYDCFITNEDLDRAICDACDVVRDALQERCPPSEAG